MASAYVNLDALIPREDLAAPATMDANKAPVIKLSDLEATSLSYAFLRKPDFQRETANWSPQQILDLVETFLSGNIIPSIVMWKNGKDVFVIDGSHRLSALIAWVQDDYGAGAISIKHYQNSIPVAQKTIHDDTRKLIEDRIGTYEQHKAAALYPSTTPAPVMERASRMAWREMSVQWVDNSTVDQARDAFFRINQGGTKIDPTEIKLLRSNSSAISISTRAVARGGSGHAYWDIFGEEANRAETAKLGLQIKALLFEPRLIVPIKTLDLPLAGFEYGSHVLPFAFDLIATTNRIVMPSGTSKGKWAKEFPDDKSGAATVEFLKKTKKMVELVLSKERHSLGLHPALYFYSPDGSFQATTLFNMTHWLMELYEQKKLNNFVKVRARFEAIIMAHPAFVHPPKNALGSGKRTRARMVELFSQTLSHLEGGMTADEAWASLIAEEKFGYLVAAEAQAKQDAAEGVPGRAFDRAAKSGSYLAQAVSTAIKCPLCQGLMHTNGMVSDHTEERSKGGSSARDNARQVHPICNSNREMNERQAS